MNLYRCIQYEVWRNFSQYIHTVKSFYMTKDDHRQMGTLYYHSIRDNDPPLPKPVMDSCSNIRLELVSDQCNLAHMNEPCCSDFLILVFIQHVILVTLDAL